MLCRSLGKRLIDKTGRKENLI